MSLQDKIATVMENFDFVNVKKAMDLLDWKWGRENRVPTIAELQECALGLLQGAVAQYEMEGRPMVGTSHSTGGFIASVFSFEGGVVEVQLLFYVSEYSA